MEKISELLKRPLVIGIVAFLLGTIFGLVVLGWGVWPVQWVDASAKELREDLREDYLRMAIDSYTINKDINLAKQRLNELGDKAKETLDKIKKDNRSQDAGAIGEFDKILQGQLGPGTGSVSPESQATPLEGTQVSETQEPVAAVTPTEEKAAAGTRSNLTVVLGLLCLLTLVVGGILAYLFLFKGRGLRSSSDAGVTIPRSQRATSVAYEEEAGEAPLHTFNSYYHLGADLYDDSFSIDSVTGEFLGECGVGISETIGVGDPKKVTAFEVWVFDKNDIQTVTKVLMSQHAYNDPVISQRLASKGEVVLAEPGKHLTLETKTLILEARIVNMEYGKGALPENSYFEEFSLELNVYRKPSA